MPSPLRQLAWDDCLLIPIRDRRLEAELKREVGQVPGWTRYFWSSPWFTKAMIRLGFDNGLLMNLDFDLALVVALVASQENSCRYCYAAVRAMLRLLNLNEDRVQDLERRLAHTEVEPKVAAAVRFARTLNRGSPLDGSAEREALQCVGFNPEEIRELAFVVVSMGLMNRLSTAAALSPTTWERVPDHWAVTLCQPLITWGLKRMRKPGARDPGPPPQSPLMPALVRAYGRSPIARVLAETLNDLWSAPAVSQHLKLLIIATVASGIDCRLCRAEVLRLAAVIGIDSEVLMDSVAHIDHPSLDAPTRAILMFTRDSLWYEPWTLQQRTRALIALLGAPLFVEILAAVTLANLFTRLTAAVVEES